MILIGDHRTERAEELKKLLQKDFSLSESIVVKENFEQIQTELSELGTSYFLVFIVGDLPSSSANPIYASSTQILNLSQKQTGIFFCYQTFQPLLFEVDNLFHLPSFADSNQLRSIINRVHRLKRPPITPSQLTGKITWDENDSFLKSLIRSLGSENKYEGENGGKRILQEWIHKKLDFTEAEVKPLMQGKSGSCVFHINYKKGNTENDIVLKLLPDGNTELAEKEIYNYDAVSASLKTSPYDVRLPKYFENLSNIKKETAINNLNTEISNQMLADPEPRLVKKRIVIVYDFLGGNKFGKLLSLSSILTIEEQNWHEKFANRFIDDKTNNIQHSKSNTSHFINNNITKARRFVLREILDWLCQTWYFQGVERNVPNGVWQFTDSYIKYQRKPPYGLTSNTKDQILNFLHSNEINFGYRVFTDWEAWGKKVLNFIEITADDEIARNSYPKLYRIEKIVSSPIHGDLNCSNILFWIDNLHPFLIDFPFFHESGHAMQDLAQLEVEIKFALMDKQKDSPKLKLPAFDFSNSQIALWQDLEIHLLDQKHWNEPMEIRFSEGYFENTSLCLVMVQMIRQHAYEIRKAVLKDFDKENFFDEYSVALLYHTLRIIGYSDISIFKRLLAIQSAGKLIGQMELSPRV